MTEPFFTMVVGLATAGVSIWAFGNQAVERKYIFRPEDILARKEYYRLVTSAFLHAGWGHLLLNIYVLCNVGSWIEWEFGPSTFLLVYFGSVIGGSLLSLYLHRHHDYSAYGASGGVCGLLYACVLAHPQSSMAIFPLPYALPAWLWAIAFGVASFYAMKRGDNIGHDAHLGGALIGLWIAGALHPRLVEQHWVVFACLTVLGALLLAYVRMNPLFLPLSNFITFAPAARKQAPPRPDRRRVQRDVPRPSGSSRPTPRPVPRPTSSLEHYTAHDWLISEIEIQVGKLERDKSGLHDWVDRFGRTYKVVAGTADTFALDSYTKLVKSHLQDPQINFLIADTRQLHPNQVDLLRPFFADLPDSEFNRILRSFAFKQKVR
jgi:membrane associated rhomboid family serine protease